MDRLVNNTRIHSALEYRTPAEFETEHYLEQNEPAQRPLADQLTLSRTPDASMKRTDSA